MKKHAMKLNQLCEDLYNSFLVAQKTYENNIYIKLHDIFQYFYHHKITEERLEIILQLERKIMNGKGPNRHVIETDILKFLSFITWRLKPKQDHDVKDDKEILKYGLLEQPDDPNKRKQYRLALKLVNFVFDIYDFKRPRDTFRTKRRVLCIRILGELSQRFEIPKAVDLCIATLDDKKEDSTLAALDFLEDYYLNRKLSLPNAIIEKLDKLRNQTHSRDVATEALNLQLKT